VRQSKSMIVSWRAGLAFANVSKQTQQASVE
jgi:hypothetical protein